MTPEMQRALEILRCSVDQLRMRPVMDEAKRLADDALTSTTPQPCTACAEKQTQLVIARGDLSAADIEISNYKSELVEKQGEIDRLREPHEIAVFGFGNDIRFACPKCNCTMLAGHPMNFCNNCGVYLRVPVAPPVKVDAVCGRCKGKREIVIEKMTRTEPCPDCQPTKEEK